MLGSKVKYLLLGIILLIPSIASSQVRQDQGDTNVAIRDNANRILGKIQFISPQHIICDSGCTSTPLTNYALETGGKLSNISSSLDNLASNMSNMLNAYNGGDGIMTSSGYQGLAILGVDRSGGPLSNILLGIPLSFGGASVLNSIDNFPTTASTDAVSVRCVNAAGDTFESCAGGSGGTTGQQTMANSSPVVIASNQSSIPVTGTFFQTTQPISVASLPLPVLAATSTIQTNGTQVTSVNNASGASAVNIQDGGNIITVDGTVAVSNTAFGITQTGSNNDVDILSLPTLPAGTNNIGDVDVLTLPSITGTVTSNAGTNTSTANLDVALSTRLKPADTLAGITTVTTVGTVTAVTAITNALPAGANNIGDVDILSEIPGTGATNLGKAEDAAHNSGDVGVLALAVRKDDATQITGAAVENSPISVDAYGAVYARSDHPNRIRCGTAAVSTAVILTLATSCGAPGAGLSIYITDISFATSVAATFAADQFPTLKYGTGGACGTGTTIFWGGFAVANTTTIADLTTPIKIPANNEVCWMMSLAGSKFVTLTGYIAP
jgi:hypothetical protein